MFYLLDTNHCSYIINGSSQVINALNTHGSDSVGISIITYAELLYMTDTSQKAVENKIAVEAFLTHVELYFIDEATAVIYSRIKASIFNHFGPKDKKKRRHTSMSNLGFTDHNLWIVATAIQHGLTPTG